jgi:predicted MFS family arabinose efflux permease
LLEAYGISAVAQSFGTVAIAVAVFDQTGSAGWVGAVATARLAPYVLLPGIPGVVADRVPRRALLVGSSALRAVLIAVVALCVALEVTPLFYVALAFVFTVVGTPCYPTLAAAVPSTLSADDLASGNALLTVVETLSFAVGPALGGLVLLGAAPSAALLVNAAIFVLACLLATRLTPVPAAVGNEREESLVRSATAGARVIVSSGEVAAPVLLVAVVNLVYGGALVALVVVADELLDAGQGGFGLLNAGLGIGGCLGVLATNRMARSRRPLGVLALTTLLTGVPYALLAVADLPTIAFVLMIVAGAGSVLTEIFAITLVQRAVATEVLARVFSMLDSLLFGAILLGSIVAPFLIDLVGVRASLVLVGAVVPTTAVIFARRLHVAGLRATEVRDALTDRVRLLGAVPWLRGALVPTLEAVAAYSTVEQVPAGALIVTEGEEPDDFFVIVEGDVEVCKKAAAETHDVGAVVAVLGPGTGFGEIGLLERVPRTATCRARGQVTLLRVDGETFVSAVSALSAAAGSALAGGVLGRLGGAGAAESARAHE